MMYDLEGLREIFKDQRQHIGIGTVSQLGLANDGSILRVMINLLPENREVVAEMTFADVMDICFPEIKDLAIVVFVDGHPDDCYVIALVNTKKEEPIPKFAQSGDKVAYSRPGKKFYIGSDTKVGIGRPNVEPHEPLVLGTQLKNFLSDALTQLAQLSGDVKDLADQVSSLADDVALHMHPTAAVGPPSPPITAAAFEAIKAQATLTSTDANGIKTQLNNYKSSPVQDGSLNSQIAYTEKGAP